MANYFSGDSNCKALWSFESGAITADGIGSNTLTNNNGVTSQAITSPPGDGSYAASFAGSTNYFSITDASLDSGFPLKYGDTNKKLSVGMWVKPTALPAQNQYLFSKYVASTGQRCFAITLSGSSAGFEVLLGYNNGDSYDTIQFATGLVQVDRWYHVGVTYDDATGYLRIRVWDDTAQDYIASDYYADPGISIWTNSTANLAIGCRSDGNGDRDFTGLIDEVVVFNDILSTSEIDDIRKGYYNIRWTGSDIEPGNRDGATAANNTYIFDETIKVNGYITHIEAYVADHNDGVLDLGVFSKSGLDFTDEESISGLSLSNGLNQWSHEDGDFDAADLPVSIGQYFGFFISSDGTLDRHQSNGPGPGYYYASGDNIDATPSATTFTLSGNTGYEIQIRVYISDSIPSASSSSNSSLSSESSESSSSAEGSSSSSVSSISSGSSSSSESSTSSESSESLIVGAVAWGHETGVTQDSSRLFTGNWTGTGIIVGEGDSERILLEVGQYMESEVWKVGSDLVSISLGQYQASSGNVTLEYRQGATAAACEGASYQVYAGTFSCLGYVQIKITA